MICIPILAKSTDEALRKIALAGPLADVLEFRLDWMESFRLEDMLRVASKPVIATYRSEREGGKGIADHAVQTRCLLKAMDAGDSRARLAFEMECHRLKKYLGS